jgi:hypothetical protein
MSALALSQVTALDVGPVAPRMPTLALSQVTALDASPVAPRVPALALSQITALDVGPVAPEMSTLHRVTMFPKSDLSNTPTQDLEGETRHIPAPRPLNTRTVTEEVSGFQSLPLVTPGPETELDEIETLLSSINQSSEKLDEDRGNVGRPKQRQRITNNGQNSGWTAINKICDSASNSGSDLSTSRKVFESIIVDTNYGEPIVIDDETDHEKDKTSMDLAVNDPGSATVHSHEIPHGKQPTRQKPNLRKRTSTKRRLEVSWASTSHENEVLEQLRALFYQHESYWMYLRERPGLVDDDRVRQHDALVKTFGEKSRAQKTISTDGLQSMCDSCLDLEAHVFSTLQVDKAAEMFGHIRGLLDQISDHTETICSIYAYRDQDGDKGDLTYRPSKKRRL